MPDDYRRKSFEEQLWELIFTLLHLGWLKANNAADVSHVYGQEAKYEKVTPGVVIGECRGTVFAGPRLDQTKELKQRKP